MGQQNSDWCKFVWISGFLSLLLLNGKVETYVLIPGLRQSEGIPGDIDSISNRDGLVRAKR